MKAYQFKLKTSSSSDAVWESLASQGWQLLYAIEEADSGVILVATGSASQSIPQLLEKFPAVCAIDLIDLPEEIDWGEQWRVHGGAGDNGVIAVELSDFDPSCSASFSMSPGPGFGDLSHMTTRLALDLLTKHAAGRTVIDIGCGSGVLSLAAALAGATEVWAMDIDPAALDHTACNARRNGLEGKIHCVDHLDLNAMKLDGTPPPLFVMNMISSEQLQVYRSLSQLWMLPACWITSGILTEQHAEYLALCARWGWSLVEKKSDGVWQAYSFQHQLPKQ
jgi:ribosomal protein L11 methyltransferase